MGESTAYQSPSMSRVTAKVGVSTGCPFSCGFRPLYPQEQTFSRPSLTSACDPKPKWVSICVKLTGATYLLNKLIGSVVAENIRVSGQMHRVNQAGQLTARNTHQHRIYSCTNRSRFHMSTYSQIDELLRPLLDSSVAATGNADFFAYANRIMPDHC